MSLKSIQRKREYTKYVVDKRLCYYEPPRDKLQKTFAQELSSSLDQKQKSIKGCILNYRYEFLVNIYIFHFLILVN